jgi:hypothetical protein
MGAGVMPKIMYDDILRQTKKAIRYKVGDEKVWIPISQIQHEDLIDQMIELPIWLIHEKGLEDYII